MNFQLKTLPPLSVLLNSLRVLVVTMPILTLLSFLMSGPQARAVGFGRVLLVSITFALAYTVVASLILTFMAVIYNLWTKRFRGLTVRLEQLP